MSRKVQEFDSVDVLEFDTFLDALNVKIEASKHAKPRKNGRYREYRNTERRK